MGDAKRAPPCRESLRVSGGLITWDDVERYKPLDPANARLRHFVAELHRRTHGGCCGCRRRCPLRSVGRVRGPRIWPAEETLDIFVLAFVPKVVAAVLSYEAERLMFGPLERR